MTTQERSEELRTSAVRLLAWGGVRYPKSLLIRTLLWTSIAVFSGIYFLIFVSNFEMGQQQQTETENLEKRQHSRPALVRCHIAYFSNTVQFAIASGRNRLVMRFPFSTASRFNTIEGPHVKRRIFMKGYLQLLDSDVFVPLSLKHRHRIMSLHGANSDRSMK